MSYEEIGVRLRTDGVVEATRGTEVFNLALQTMANRAGAAVPALAGMSQAAVDVASTQAAAGVAISGASMALGGVAAAAALASVAYVKGANEAREYSRQIILTGNAAGVTTGMLGTMASNVDAIVGTQAQSAAVLAQLVSTGNVSRAQLEIATQAAIALQRSLGVEVGHTVAAFSSLGREPLKAAVKLNEQQHFLTMETYEQIRALEKHGATSVAAAVAQEAFAKAGIERAKEMETHLGILERGWRGVTEHAKEAWDAMLGIGREKTTQDRLTAVQARIAAAPRQAREEASSFQAGFGPAMRLGPAFMGLAGQPSELQALKQEEADLQEMLRLQQRGADLQARRAAAVAAKAKADAEADAKRAPHAGRSHAFVGPPSFDDEYPAANVRDIISRRDVNRAARVAELASYEAVDKEVLANRRATELEQRKLADETFEYRVTQERQFVEAVKPEWQQMLEAWQDANKQMRDGWDTTMMATLQAGESAWVRWAETGKLNIRSVFASWFAEQARTTFRGGVGGLAALFGFGGVSNLNGAGEVFKNVGAAHGGAIIGGTPTFTRSVSASVFAGAARFHGGGLVGDEVPAILRRREGVFTPEQMAALAPVDRLAGGGRPLVFAPVFHIDARSDRNQIEQLMQRGMQAAQADLLEKLDRREI